MSDKLREAVKELAKRLHEESGIMQLPVSMTAAFEHIAQKIDILLASNPPEAQAEGWQQEWECDVCGYLYKAPRPHGDNCIGTMHRIDRRKSDEDHEIENAVRDIHCKQCGTWYKEGCDHECKPTTVKSDEAGLRESFVAGAKWWEFESTGGTMWQSDQGKAYTEAIKRYPLKGEKKWKCSNGHISTKEPVDGKCLLCGLVVGQGEEKKG